MSIWLIPVLLAAAGLAWIESRRPNRRHLGARVTAVLLAVASLIVLLSASGEGGRVILLTPGAPLTARARGSITLDEAQSLGGLASRQAVRLAGWGLLPHEWPDSVPPIKGFERIPLPVGVVALDAPAEVAVGERLVVRGNVTLPSGETAEIVLEDPAGPRDSALVSSDHAVFELSDRPKAPGAVAYRLRLRRSGHPEVAETLGVAVRVAGMPAVLVLDASPSFETAALKRWLAERGATVTVRTAISRDRYRTEAINRSLASVAGLTAGSLSRFDAVLADGGTLAGLSQTERAALERQVRERGLGLLITADAPALLSRCTCGLLSGLKLEPIEVATSGSKDRDSRRVARPVLPEAPRQSRVGIDADAASLKPAAVEPVIRDEVGRIVAGWRQAGVGRVGATLLRSPSRWLLEGEPDLYAAYWYGLLRAVTRDTTTRVRVSGEGPLRTDHPAVVTIDLADAPDSGNAPVAAVKAPDGQVDTLALAQDPFDPARFTGRYWPRSVGWHWVELQGGRTIPFRVTRPGEWTGLEASARLSSTAARVAAAGGLTATREGARALLEPLAFALLLLALTWLWIEGRRAS